MRGPPFQLLILVSWSLRFIMKTTSEPSTDLEIQHSIVTARCTAAKMRETGINVKESYQILIEDRQHQVAHEKQ